MKRVLPFAILAVLIAAGVGVSLTVGSSGGDEDQVSTAIVDPAVWDALTVQDEVEVYISLRKLEVPLQEQTTEMRKTHAAELQAGLLAFLPSEEFELTYQFPVTAALTVRITKDGVSQAAAHPDVVGIVVPGTGTRG